LVLQPNGSPLPSRLRDSSESSGGVDLSGKHSFAFDTKLGAPLSDSAAKFIEKELKIVGIQIIASRE
jgi:hypothetical protein